MRKVRISRDERVLCPKQDIKILRARCSMCTSNMGTGSDKEGAFIHCAYKT